MSASRNPPTKPAFEVSKGKWQVMTLSEADVERHLHPSELLDALEEGFKGLERGEVQAPPRTRLSVPGHGFSLAMSAWQPGMHITVKIVNVFDGNLAIDLPNHLALITLFDPTTGGATCVMDGTLITGIRTAACAVLSARLLSRKDSRVATVIGAGVQAREHLRLLPLIRDFERINVCSLRYDDAEKLAGRSDRAKAARDVEQAVRESDIVCLATHSPAPVIDADWVKPGTHVTSVGFHPPDGELPRALAIGCRLFVETLDAFKPAPIGCADLGGVDPARGTTLGALVLGRQPGRLSDSETTVYKAMGVAMEDMVAANLVYRRAKRDGGGGVMAW